MINFHVSHSENVKLHKQLTPIFSTPSLVYLQVSEYDNPPNVNNSMTTSINNQANRNEQQIPLKLIHN